MIIFRIFLIVLLIHLTVSYSLIFVWFNKSKFSNSEPKENAATGSAFTVNIVGFQLINNSHEKSANRFLCIGTLVSENYVVTTANCVTVPIGTHIGVQFDTNRGDTNEIRGEYGGKKNVFQ
jgi:hypothetical protein